VAAAQCPRAVQLDGRVDNELRGLGGEQFGHRRAAAEVLLTGVVRGRGGVDEQARGFGPGGHFGEGVRDRLLFDQRAAERDALPGVFDGGVQSGLSHADRERADAGPEQIQGSHGDSETAVLFAEKLFSAH